MRRSGDLLAGRDIVDGHVVALIKKTGPETQSLELSSSYYDPPVSEDFASEIALSLVTRQRGDFQRLIDAGRAAGATPVPGEPTAVPISPPVALIDRRQPTGDHVWIFQGQQNLFAVGWRETGLLVVARADPGTGRGALTTDQVEAVVLRALRFG
jgi:hypothetical protein